MGSVTELARRIRSGLRSSTGLKRLYATAVRSLRPAGRAPRQIVICGYPRSGTSLLYNMMASSLRGFYYEQFEVPAAKYVGWNSNVISKKPLDVFDLESLVAQNVYGKTIIALVVIRDLRDVVTSVHPRVPDDYFIGYESSYRTNLPTGPALVQPGVKAIFDRIERLKTARGLRTVFVRYEDLVEDPDATQEQLAHELDVSFCDTFSKFHEHGEKLPYRYVGAWAAKDPSLAREDKPVDKERLGKWRRPEHWERIADQFGRFPELMSMVRHYGYEKDDAWFVPFRRVASGALPTVAAKI